MTCYCKFRTKFQVVCETSELNNESSLLEKSRVRLIDW